VAVTLLGLRPPSLLGFLQHRLYDTWLRTGPTPPATGRVVVVDVDERSLARHGQWPWPRYRLARLLEKIREGRPAVVALDMVFAEPDRTSLEGVRREMERDLGIALEFRGLPADLGDNDQILARELSRGPCVLGYQLTFGVRRDAPSPCVLHPLPLATAAAEGETFPLRFFNASGATCNLPLLSGSVTASGFFNVIPDEDGLLRRVPLAVSHQGTLQPALPLAALLRLRGQGAVVARGGLLERGFLLDGRRIPLDGRGNLLVRYRGPRGTLPSHSAADVLEGTLPDGALDGRLVVVGTSAAGLVELRSTPRDTAHPGPEIQATVLDNLLAGDYLARPPWAQAAEALGALCTGGGGSFLLAGLPAMAGAGAVLGAAVVLLASSWWLMAVKLTFLSPVIPLAALGGSFVVVTSLRFWQSEREVRERTRKLTLTQDAIIRSMAALAETRDQETGGHIQRTRHYVLALAQRLKDHPRFRDRLDADSRDLLFRLAPLHDIGKVGVRDHILLKPGRLTPEEFEEMKKHTLYGSETLRLAERHLGEDSFLHLADQIARSHQEKWDGSGYPEGLKGEAIPLPARLMAVADVYDALISRRGYKEPLSHREAVETMRQGRGTHFDPDILDAFLEGEEEFRAIAARFAGPGAEPLPEVGPVRQARMD
jgi:adenylate cyclase